MTLCLGAGAEELLPKMLGVGFPVLLVLSQIIAVRRQLVAAVLFAVAAGAVEDSLCSLPYMTSISFFLLAALLVRRAEIPLAASVFTYPAYQIWLSAWTVGLGGGVFVRILLALPVGVVTAIAAGWLLQAAERRAALGEQG